MNRHLRVAIGSLCIAALTTGCGAFPDVLLETARGAAQQALTQVVDETVGGLVDDVVNSGGLQLPTSGENEE